MTGASKINPGLLTTAPEEEEMPTPPCRVCQKTDPVLVYPDQHGMTICPECCAKAEHPDGEKGHQFKYDPADRTHWCDYCGIDRKCTDYEESYYPD
jgi:hypothetical protein